MKTALSSYSHGRDFLRVRDFLKQNLFINGRPVNWGFERWNWARFHPLMFLESDPSVTERNLKWFDESIRLCLSETGEILAMVNVELPLPHEKGTVHFQHSEKGIRVLGPLFEYAEKNLADMESGIIRTWIYDYDTGLQEAASGRGWTINGDWIEHMAEYTITERPPENLPDGFVISSMAEDGDYAQRCRLNGLGFNHPDPKDWTVPAEYMEVQKAPDYHPEFDLFVKTPEGEYVSGCIFWYDDYNNAVTFEPVCTIPEYRRKGFGREVMYAGIRKAADLGADRAFVGSSQEFYKDIGFDMKYPSHEWVRKL